MLTAGGSKHPRTQIEKIQLDPNFDTFRHAEIASPITLVGGSRSGGVAAREHVRVGGKMRE